MRENGAKILIVDDSKEMCEIFSFLMKKEGFEPQVAFDGPTAIKAINRDLPSVLLVDIKMPVMDGMEVLKQAKKLDQSLPVIMITGYAEVRGAVEAFKAGACDYITKPLDNRGLVQAVRRALSERKFENPHDRNRQEENCSLRESMGPSDIVSQLIYDVNQVAKSNFTVVVQGETGAGKELLAWAIHNASLRLKSAFVPIDCGAIPETLLESELFGYEKGAFTGAEAKREGKIESAQGGTLFLDEITNMPLGSQAKILRVLQNNTLYRVGSSRPVNVDVRLVVASSEPLEVAVASGRFRSDLFYRLNEFKIIVQPLRGRKEDISYLANRFLGIANIELGKTVKGFSESALKLLSDYEWPGNVRQLRSITRRAVLMADKIITEAHLDLNERVWLPAVDSVAIPKVKDSLLGGLTLKEISQRSSLSVEREVILQVLRKTGWNKAKASRILKIDYKTVYAKMKKLGISINQKEGGI
ncbi:MAG: sigma-54 dependent transcriptional regulator [Proteobacteria bacterium]|nr:sigma-54 dependent transcriptional regulator [Pseudomonadota bacterium]